MAKKESAPRLRQDLADVISEKKDQLFWTGAAMTVAGILALLFPVFTTLSVELMVGWLLVFAGAATLYGAFSIEGTRPFFGQLLLGLLKLALGVYLLTHPQVGAMALTLILATIFMVDGAAQLAFAFDLKPREEWLWVLGSGVISIAAGLLIAAGLPGTSLFALGLLVGANFLSTGIASLVLSSKLPKLLAPAKPAKLPRDKAT